MHQRTLFKRAHRLCRLGDFFHNRSCEIYYIKGGDDAFADYLNFLSSVCWTASAGVYCRKTYGNLLNYLLEWEEDIFLDSVTTRDLFLLAVECDNLHTKI